MNRFFLQKRQKSCADMILDTSSHQLCGFLFGGGARLLRHAICWLDATEGGKNPSNQLPSLFSKGNKRWERWDFLSKAMLRSSSVITRMVAQHLVIQRRASSTEIRCCIEICFPFSPASWISRRWHACAETSSLGWCARTIDCLKIYSFTFFFLSLQKDLKIAN